MFTLTKWAHDWRVPDAALLELQQIIGMITTPQNETLSEAAVSSRVRLRASKKGIILWRNNVGVAIAENGVPVRYGLANESKKINRVLKSSDFIGISPYKVQVEDVGRILGIFTAYEVKKTKWAYTATAHEVAQLNFITLVNSKGGYAKFINNENKV